MQKETISGLENKDRFFDSRYGGAGELVPNERSGGRVVVDASFLPRCKTAHYVIGEGERIGQT